jgi:hypothetical protein
MLFVMVEPPINDPGQQGRDRYPEELVPIEEGEAEKPRLNVIVEGDPEEPDIGDQEEEPQPAGGASLRRMSVHHSQAQGLNCTSNPVR